MSIHVVKLSENHQTAFRLMLADYDANDPEPGEWYAKGLADFSGYVQSLADEEMGHNLSAGMVPCSHRWLLDDKGAIIGIVRVRHNLDLPHLFNEVGHIGYDVPPNHRGRGYAIESLKVGLQCARDVGLNQVLVCADDANPPSWRTIERCNGVFELSYWSEFWNCQVRRYWIDL